MKRRLTSNKAAGAYTTAREPFKANNCFAEVQNMPDGDQLYCVYSWGYHWPMYVYSERAAIWFENADNRRRSVSTRQHANHCCPRQLYSTSNGDHNHIQLRHSRMEHLVRRGTAELGESIIARVVEARMLGEGAAA